MRERGATRPQSVLRRKCCGNAGSRDAWLADFLRAWVVTYATAQTLPVAMPIVRIRRREPH